MITKPKYKAILLGREGGVSDMSGESLDKIKAWARTANICWETLRVYVRADYSNEYTGLSEFTIKNHRLHKKLF